MIHRYEKPVKGKLSDCVSELNKYLSVYQCDAEGWFELAEIYLSEYEYEKAAYCFEELIILNPANYIIYQVNNFDIMTHKEIMSNSRDMLKRKRLLVVLKIWKLQRNITASPLEWVDLIQIELYLVWSLSVSNFKQWKEYQQQKKQNWKSLSNGQMENYK